MNKVSTPATASEKKSRMTAKQFAATYGSLVALVVLIIVFTMLNSRFVSPANIRNTLRIASINGLLAFGMTFVVLTGGIDLSVGAVMGCAGMYSAYFAQTSMGFPGCWPWSSALPWV